jgi:hypothetical protein
LIALRGRHHALRQGHVEFLCDGAAGRIAYWRGAGPDRLLVVVNLSPDETALPEAARGGEVLYEKGLLGESDDRRMGAYASTIVRARTHQAGT